MVRTVAPVLRPAFGSFLMWAIVWLFCVPLPAGEVKYATAHVRARCFSHLRGSDSSSIPVPLDPRTSYASANRNEYASASFSSKRSRTGLPASRLTSGPDFQDTARPISSPMISAQSAREKPANGRPLAS